MTTPSSQQPTSSASSAEQRDIVAKAIYDAFEYSGAGTKPTWWRIGNSQKQDEARKYAEAAIAAIVPQVVQAPIEAWLIESYDCNDKLKKRVVLAPITDDVHLDESSEAFALCRVEKAAPIVATVPSEPVAHIVEDGDGTQPYLARLAHPLPPVGTKLYAAPISPAAEQASDVRNAAPSGWQFSVEHDDDNRSWLTIKTPMGTRASFSCTSKIDSGGMTIAAQVLDYLKDELVKSAPAAKGNAQDEVKS